MPPNEKIAHERRDVHPTIAQGRNSDDESAESEIQVFAKRSRLDGSPQVTVRGGHDSSVNFDAALGADATDFSFLQSSEKLGLYRRSNLANLVQENRAATGDLEEARLVLGPHR